MMIHEPEPEGESPPSFYAGGPARLLYPQPVFLFELLASIRV